MLRPLFAKAPARSGACRGSWLLVLACFSLACQLSRPPERQVVRYFSTYRVQDPTGIEVAGLPVPRWVQIEGKAIPALVTCTGFSVWMKTEPGDGLSFSGSYTLLETPQDSQPEATAEVIFRVNVADPSRKQRRTVFEDSVDRSTSLPRHAHVLLPEEWSGGYVGIEVEHVGGSASISAAWLDPRTSVPVATKSPTLPSVLLVTADTTRRDDLAPYGGSAATPTLQLLASDGARFDNASTVATGTTPSHASLFTASHAVTHGVYDNETILSSDLTTLAEVLSEDGYETAAFVSAVPAASALGLSQGFQIFDEFFGEDPGSGLGGYSSIERRANRTTSRFLEWLESRAGGPFFAWVHYYDPHQPYSAPTPYQPIPPSERIAGLFETATGEPRYVGGPHPEAMPRPSVLSQGLALEAVSEYARSRYRGEIEYMDSELGRIVEQLRGQGLYDDTLIVFTADHGENFIEHGPQLAFTHASLFGSVVHIPLIVKLPGGRYDGVSTKELVATIDIAPTILSVLGRDAPSVWEGISVLDSLGQGTPPTEERTIVIESADREEFSIRSLEWMYREVRADLRYQQDVVGYLELDEGGRELYDLTTDSGEARNIYPNDRATFLLQRLEAFQKRPSIARSKLQDEAHSRALRALGYVR